MIIWWVIDLDFLRLRSKVLHQKFQCTYGLFTGRSEKSESDPARGSEERAFPISLRMARKTKKYRCQTWRNRRRKERRSTTIISEKVRQNRFTFQENTKLDHIIKWTNRLTHIAVMAWLLVFLRPSKSVGSTPWLLLVSRLRPSTNIPHLLINHKFSDQKLRRTVDIQHITQFDLNVKAIGLDNGTKIEISGCTIHETQNKQVHESR